ncbi:MAG TPA: ATP-binding cassette domain-containing protein [Pseudonocardiaceae bacterium]|nr:ATP-binding cassette domain-containing protein [Pseudonocardiaceae bacterium]
MTAAESHSPQAAHWRLLFGVLRARRGLLGRVFLWSAVAAVPAFLSGRLVAAAVDRGFLANRPALGFGWLGVRELVERLGGYAAQVDPAALSAGERQLLTLARAYLSPARLVILDEATCHLDPAADARVERAFAQRPGTLVVMAHRISSAMRARRVLVLDGSRALLGTHEELLTCSLLYRDLVGHWHPVEYALPRLLPPDMETCRAGARPGMGREGMWLEGTGGGGLHSVRLAYQRISRARSAASRGDAG